MSAVRLGRPLAAILLAIATMFPGAGSVAANNGGCGYFTYFSSTVSFPSGYWSAGDHTLAWSWSVYGSGTVTFSVDPGARLYPGHVWITPVDGLLADPGVPITAVNPDQETIFWDVYGFTDPADVLAVHNTTQETLSWDGGDPRLTHFSGPGSACQAGGPSKVTSQFIRSLGPRIR